MYKRDHLYIGGEWIAPSDHRTIPVRNPATEDVVGTALYLLSDMSSFVTGQAILVNGGAVMH